jgi:hypothetical protein
MYSRVILQVRVARIQSWKTFAVLRCPPEGMRENEKFLSQLSRLQPKLMKVTPEISREVNT